MTEFPHLIISYHRDGIQIRALAQAVIDFLPATAKRTISDRDTPGRDRPIHCAFPRNTQAGSQIVWKSACVEAGGANLGLITDASR